MALGLVSGGKLFLPFSTPPPPLHTHIHTEKVAVG